MKKFLYPFFSLIFLALGIIGILLPVLPTVPFLLAALHFAAGTPVLQKHLLKIPAISYAAAIRAGHKKISRKIKYRAVLWLYLSLTLTGVICRDWRLWILLLIVGIAVSWHLIHLPTED